MHVTCTCCICVSAHQTVTLLVPEIAFFVLYSQDVTCKKEEEQQIYVCIFLFFCLVFLNSHFCHFITYRFITYIIFILLYVSCTIDTQF